MLRRTVTVRNITDKPITITDKRLSNKQLTLLPGNADGVNDFGLGQDIFMDHRRKYINRIVDVSRLVPVAEEVEFSPTHLLGDVPVMIGEQTAKRVYFTLADGSNSYRKIENWESEAVEITVAPEEAKAESEETTEETNENA